MTSSEGDSRPGCLASLHDVMPETWSEVQEVLAWLKARRVPPVSLLVVPGRDWKLHHIEQIKRWAEDGHPLVAHGWFHHVEDIRGLRHRLHSALISRNVAEHLALDSKGVLELLKRAKAWFPQQGLPPPSLYIPPAWALGSIRQNDLLDAPYDHIEVTRGLLNPQSGRLTKLPLTGFEADTGLRESCLRLWNSMAVKKARRKSIPLRLSIHPFDLKLRLRDQLEEIVSMNWRYLDYEAWSGS